MFKSICYALIACAYTFHGLPLVAVLYATLACLELRECRRIRRAIRRWQASR